MRILFVSLLFLSAACSHSAASDTKSQDLSSPLDAIADYYSGETLLASDSIRFEEDIRTFYDGYSYGPGFHDLTAQRRHFVLDPTGERGSAEYLTQIGASTFHARTILADGEALIIDYGNDTYQPLGEQSYWGEFGSIIRTSDVLLAREVLSRPEDTYVAGQEMWLGRWHHKISLTDQNGGPQMTLLADVETGRISHMYREIGSAMRPGNFFDRPLRVSYTFDRPVTRDGLTFASEHSVFAGERLLYLSLNRNYALGLSSDADLFEVESDVRLEPERVDQSEMTVELVTEGIYHVGQGEAYSTVFVRPNGLVIFGARAGIEERIEALRGSTELTLPVTHVIAADHHTMELADLEAALHMGATVVVPQGAHAGLFDSLGDENVFSNIQPLTEDIEVDGVSVLSFPSAHSHQNLAALETQSGTLAQVYHYGNPYADAPFFAMPMALSLNDAVSRRELSPSLLLSAANRNPIPWVEFEAAIDAYDGKFCPSKRAICEGFTR